MSSYNAGIFDFYDDRGALLRSVATESDDIPDFVKSAAAVGHDSAAQLYALVMVDSGTVLKKYATADKGNTWLSTLYFALTKDDLPLEAQKVAAANLIEACEAYDVEAPELLWEVADGPVSTNLVDVTDVRPLQKVAAAREEVEVNYAIERADGSQYYPLRDAKDVTVAMEYFDRNASEFVPRERREYAVKVAAQARRGALPLTEKIAAYSGSGWNPNVEGYITQRDVYLRKAGAPLPARTQLAKLAQVRDTFNPEEFADAVESFDREFGLDALYDKDIADPWFAVTGDYPVHFEKVAKGEEAPTATFTIGEVTVTQVELEQLGQRGLGTLSKHFGGAFACEYLKNPVAMFESMPLTQRKFIARLATCHADDTGMG